MNKGEISEKDVSFLSGRTGFSKNKCRDILESAEGDIEIALGILTNLRRNRVEVLWDKLSSFFVGEIGRKIYIYDGEKVLLHFPTFVPIVFLLISKMPSYLLAIFLFIIFIFDMDIKTERSIVSHSDSTTDDPIIVESGQAPETGSAKSEVVNKDGFFEFTVD
jgi:hypothetical protein